MSAMTETDLSTLVLPTTWQEGEHRADGMTFSSMRKVGRVTTQEAASDWESQRIHTYQENHGGNTPKYNKNESGK